MVEWLNIKIVYSLNINNNILMLHNWLYIVTNNNTTLILATP